jgi:hypothetical protein
MIGKKSANATKFLRIAILAAPGLARSHWWVRLHEKGGKRHEMPAPHNLEPYLDAYIEAAGIRDGGKSPLFCSAVGRTGELTPMRPAASPERLPRLA